MAPRRRPLVIALIVLAGFINGPFFLNLIGQLFTHLGALEQMDYAGRSVGMIFACASVGWALLPTTMGFMGRTYGIRPAFLLPACASAIMAGLVLANEIAA